jgi:hypothetical protein
VKVAIWDLFQARQQHRSLLLADDIWRSRKIPWQRDVDFIKVVQNDEDSKLTRQLDYAN